MTTREMVKVQVLLPQASKDELDKLAAKRQRSTSYVGREFILAGLKKAKAA